MGVFDLTGQRILVTGAAGGIGGAVVRLGVAQGAEVVASDREMPGELVESLRAEGGAVDGVAMDVADRRAVESTVADMGKLDGLIDCAAVCPFDDWEADEWDESMARVFAINMAGPVNLTRAVMKRMRAEGGGRIALVGSVAGRIGGVRASPHYVLSKGGIHSFVRWAAKQGAPNGIRTNAVAPGPVATPMTAGQAFDDRALPFGRMASAEEIAGPLVFLVSEAASYINGAVLDINGGMHFS